MQSNCKCTKGQNRSPFNNNLNLSVTKTLDKIFNNFYNIDQNKFCTALRTHPMQLKVLILIESQQLLDKECDKLTKALQAAIVEQVLTTKIGLHIRCWWTKKLMQLRQQANKLGRKSSKLKGSPNDSIHAKFKNIRKKYKKEIDYCKKHHWWDQLKKADNPDIWTTHKYISAAIKDGNIFRMPTLTSSSENTEHTASTDKKKGSMLAKTFFLVAWPHSEYPPT